MAQPIDPETGYTDSVDCECIPCRFCDGEGERWTYCENGCRKPFHPDSCPGHRWECSECHGTGKDTDDCPVHGKDALIARG